MNVLAYLRCIRNNRYLLTELLKREFAQRYSGSFLGLFWSLITPLLILSVYTFVFKLVFHTRWSSEETSNVQFALILFIGLMLHTLFSECALRAPTLIQSHASYVKRVVFPLELLPLILVMHAFLHAALSFVVWLIFYFIMHHSIPATILFMPVIIFPFLIFNLGLSLFLAVFGVYIRDVSQMMGVVITISMFITPIFYPMSAVPPSIKPFMLLNPLTFAIEQMRAIAVFNTTPDWQGLALYFLFSGIIFYFGLNFFQKARRGFADVL